MGSKSLYTVAYPDQELREAGAGFVLFALPAFLFFCDYFFIFPNQEGWARAALWVCSCCNFGLSFLHLVSSYFQSTFTESSRVETRILERVVDDPVES